MVNDKSLAGTDFNGAKSLRKLLFGLSVEALSILVLLHDSQSLRVDA